MIPVTNIKLYGGETTNEENVTAFFVCFFFARGQGFSVWMIMYAMFCTM